MRSSKFVLAWLGVAGLIVACSGAVLDAGGKSENALSCAENQRAYNGLCRATCTQTANCSGDTTCVKVDDQSLCLDRESAAHCSYLGDDTQCIGTGGNYYYGVRGHSEYFVPYTSEPPYPLSDLARGTPYSDPTFVPNSSVEYSSVGCMGDATWKVIPLTGDPACSAEHRVTRCRRYKNHCMLISGATYETASP